MDLGLGPDSESSLSDPGTYSGVEALTLTLPLSLTGPAARMAGATFRTAGSFRALAVFGHFVGGQQGGDVTTGEALAFNMFKLAEKGVVRSLPHESVSVRGHL